MKEIIIMKRIKTLATRDLKESMKKVSDFLPVSMQDLLYSRQPEL